jgi:hypothetical protein
VPTNSSCNLVKHMKWIYIKFIYLLTIKSNNVPKITINMTDLFEVTTERFINNW